MKRFWYAIAALLGIALTGCSASTPPIGAAHVPTPSGVGLPPGGFVAVSDHKLVLVDTVTGRVVRTLLAEPYRGMAVDATAVDRSGRIWVTLVRGPECSSGIAGCGPRPNTCAGTVITLNASTGSITTVLRAPAGELISDAQPSPDGRYLAYLTGRCDRSYFDQYIRVRDLTTGASWTIGASLMPCHSLGSLSWTAEGTHLVTAYARSLVTSPADAATEGYGTCMSPATTAITMVPALTGQPGMNGTTAAAETGCEIEAVTATTTGYAAIEGCGDPDTYGSGPVRLVRYSAHLGRSVEATLGACLNGAELRVSHAGTDLLGTTYQFCNPPGKVDPKTVAFTDHGSRPVTFYAKPNGGSDAFSAISW